METNYLFIKAEAIEYANENKSFVYEKNVDLAMQHAFEAGAQYIINSCKPNDSKPHVKKCNRGDDDFDCINISCNNCKYYA